MFNVIITSYVFVFVILILIKRALDMKMTERTCLIALEYHVSHLGNFMSKICKTKIRVKPHLLVLS